MAVSPFERAHYQKVKLTEQTAKRIELIYRQSAQDIRRQLRNFRIVNPSDSLKKVYLENLLKDITKSQESFNRLVEQTIRKAGEDAGNLAVNAANDAMGRYGLKMRGAYSYIPRQQVGLIASGKLYGDKWSLSSAIWKNGLRTKSDIQNVVAKGLVENKPIKDIADDITKYVDPTARKPWDWNKVYPGTAAKVDYNAQRLARTMIQHSFQASMVQAQLHNPFCKGIIWHSVGLHGRTCEQCLERDGQRFPVKDLPLDHPNGLCYFEPALDSLNDVADRLSDWVRGREDRWLDEYVANAFNVNPKSLVAKKAIAKAKTGAGKVTPTKPTGGKSAGKTAAKKTTKKTATKSAAKKSGGIEDWIAEQEAAEARRAKFIDENFDNLKKKVVQSRKTIEEGEEIWAKLRKHMIGLDDDYLRYMETGQKKLKAIIPDIDGAWYNNSKISMDLMKDLSNPRGQFYTFFHEYGHFLDDMAVTSGHKYWFSYSEKFRKTLYSSLEKEYNKLCVDGVLKYSVREDLVASDLSNGVQDIISGLSLNKNRILWGHDTDYWIAKGQERGVVLETLAHFSAAFANERRMEYFKKYFPESFDLLEKQMLDYLKKKGRKEI